MNRVFYHFAKKCEKITLGTKANDNMINRLSLLLDKLNSLGVGEEYTLKKASGDLEKDFNFFSDYQK